jgi:hypothetical protein
MEKITYTTKPEIETKEESNIRVVRQAFEALNSGDVSRVHEFISPEYFNHESQVDPVRSKLRGPEEFIDTVKNKFIVVLTSDPRYVLYPYHL